VTKVDGKYVVFGGHGAAQVVSSVPRLRKDITRAVVPDNK
jgi:hypothetical protein